MDYKRKSKDICERCHLKNNLVKIIAQRNLILFNNKSPLKYEDSVGGWGLKTIQCLVRTLSKEATNILKSCGNNSQAAL